MCNEEVKKTFWNGVFFDLNCNVGCLANRVFSESPVAEHNYDKANEIAAQHPNVHICWHIFLFFFLLNQTSVKTT